MVIQTEAPNPPPTQSTPQPADPLAATGIIPLAFLHDIALRSLDATWNRARWEALPPGGNRYEVIDGVLYVSTPPSLFHQWIVRQVVRRLLSQIDDAGRGSTFFSPVGVFMPGCDPVEPDVVVVTAEQSHLTTASKHIEGVPALLVEVRSPSHPKLDTRIKRGAYARAGVPEYWIALPATREVLVCTVPDAELGEYKETRRFALGDELVSPTLRVRFPVADLFEGAPNT